MLATEGRPTMNAIAVNAGPRKEWNTAAMLKSALEGAESVGVQTKMVHLYDFTFQGCSSCFSCKKKGNTCNGLCAMRDDLRDLLAEVLESDILFLGSPIYLDDVTGAMRSFLERLLFPSISYDEFGKSTFNRHISCGFVFTMNCPEAAVVPQHYDAIFENLVKFAGSLRGKTEIVTANETYQFTDYSKMNAAMFDVEARAKRREERFPLDCREAYEMGARLAAG
jgi:multimeric flavodoxin WrbA